MRKVALFLLGWAMPVFAQVLPNIPAGTVLGNNGGSISSPAALKNPTISGLTFPTQTLSGGGGTFGSTNSLLYSSGNTGGITLSGLYNTPGVDNQISPFDIYITSDVADVTTLPTQKWMDWLSVNGSVAAGSTGGRTAIQGRMSIDGTPTTISVGYVGVAGIMRANANMGGTTGAYTNYVGAPFGMNCNAFSTSNATFLARLVCEEADIALASGSSAAEKYGMQIVATSTDAVRGTYDDTALSFNDQDPTVVSTGSGTWTGATTSITLASATVEIVVGQMLTGTGIALDTFVTNSSGGCVTSCTLTLSKATLGSETGVTLSFSNYVGWANLISFGAYGHRAPSIPTTTYMIDQCRQTGPLEKRGCPNALDGINWSNTTFSDAFIKSANFKVDGNGGLTFGGSASYPSWTTNSPAFSPNAITLTDSTGTGTIGTEALYSFPASTLAAINAITVTNLAGVYFANPIAGPNVTATNIYAAMAASLKVTGTLNGTGGASLSGSAVTINNNSNNNTTINGGTSTGVVHIADGTGANTVDIGNTTGPTTVAILGTVSINQATSTATNIATGASSGNVHIDDGTGSGTITIGNSGNTGKTVLAGISTGTNADFLCLSSGGVVLLQASACTISSERFKRDIQALKDAGQIMGLEVVGFTLKDTGNRDPNATHPQIGLIAENVAAVEPRCAIYEDDMKTPKSYRPECITALLVKMTQDHQLVLKDHQRVISRLELEVLALFLWCVWLTWRHMRLEARLVPHAT